MNARKLLARLDGTGGVLQFNSAELDTAIRALRLLAAAEANDGTTPETDALAKLCSTQFQIAEIARSFERERNGLAARVAELEKDAERYRWIRNRLEVRGQQAFTGSVRPGISVRVGCSFFDTEARKQDESTATKLDAAIDAARSKP